jgi:hypothetical protein
MANDTALLLRDGSANLETTEGTPTAIDFRGIDYKPMFYFLSVPAVSSGDTLDVKIQGSNNNSDFYDVLVFPQVNGTTGAGVFHLEGIVNYRYRRYVATVGGNGSANFGAVKIGVVPGGRYTDL